MMSLAAGYLAASCVAACVIVIALLFISASPSPFTIDLALVRVTALMAAFVAGLVAILALLPFLIAMGYAERHAVNSPTWYGAAGAVSGVVALGLHVAVSVLREGGSMSALSDRMMLATLAGIAVVAAVAGLCAGLTFWAIAGRNTGRQNW